MVFPSGLAAADRSQIFESVSDLSGSGASGAGRCTGRGSAWCLFEYTKRCVTMQQVFVRFAPCCPEKAKKIRRKNGAVT